MKNSAATNVSCDTTPKTSPKSSPRVINPLTYFKFPRKVIKPEVKSEVGSPTNKNQNLLKKISSRIMSSRETIISPETAASVVRKYILPMFEYENRVKADIGRSSMKSNRRKYSQDQNTVYGEFKLSEKLSKELEDLTAKMIKMEQNMKDNIQDKELMAKENVILKQELHDTQINLTLYLNENQKLRRELSRLSFATNFANNQLTKTKSLYEISMKQIEDVMKEFNEEKLLNDIRLL